MKTLVACPVAKRKHYSLPYWAAATSKWGYDRVVATCEPEYISEIEKLEIPYVLHGIPEKGREGANAIYGPLFNEAWKAIMEIVADGYTHILSLESDVISEWDILDIMEEHYDGSVSFVRHGVPWRSIYRRPGGYCYETGCTLASLPDWKKAMSLVNEHGGMRTLYEVVGHPSWFTHKDIKVVELEHMDEP